MNEDIKKEIVETTKDLLQRIGFEGEVSITENGYSVAGTTAVSTENGFFTVAIDSEKDLSILIGKNGQNLNAFDHIVRLVIARRLATAEDKSPLNFIVDVNDYRKSKTNYLVEVARNVARRVIQTQKAEALLPMSSYERKLVHTELASYKEVQTESIGQEPRRRIVVKPQPESLINF
jgi:spoIIIJ-associated protein